MTLQLSNEIKMVVSDFDGVFTDGSVYISEKKDIANLKTMKMLKQYFMNQ